MMVGWEFGVVCEMKVEERGRGRRGQKGTETATCSGRAKKNSKRSFRTSSQGNEAKLEEALGVAWRLSWRVEFSRGRAFFAARGTVAA